MNIIKILNPSDTQTLGVIGTINYIGALLVYFAVLKVPTLPLADRFMYIAIGTILLVFSGIFFIKKATINAGVRHGFLNAKTQVYQRIAEKIDATNLETTKILATTLDKFASELTEEVS